MPSTTRVRVLSAVRPSPQSACHHRDHYGFDPVEHPAHLGDPTEPDVSPRHHSHNEGCRQDEAGAGDQEARPARARMADVDGQLGRVGPRNQVGRAEVVEKLLAGEPVTTTDDLVLHHGDVRRRAPEGDGAELQEESRQLAERRALRRGRRRVAWLIPHHAYVSSRMKP